VRAGGERVAAWGSMRRHSLSWRSHDIIRAGGVQIGVDHQDSKQAAPQGRSLRLS
jgi:hypothetical protein